MKASLFIASLLLILSSCNFKKSVGKDLDTGATTVGNGLSCDDIGLTSNGTIKTNNKFVDGERIAINFKNMEGFTKVGGKFYPGLSIEIRSKSGKSVEKNDDVFAEEEGFVMDPITVTAYFNAKFNEQKDKDYIVKIKVWDKKGKGTFNYEMPYSVKPNEVLTIKNKGLSAETVELFDLDFGYRIAKNDLFQTDKHEFRITGLKGFVEENGKAFIDGSVKVTDADGKILLNGEHLFSAYEKSGISAKDVSDFVSIKFNLGNDKIKEPVLIEAMVFDLKSAKTLNIQTKMDLMR